MLTNIDTDDDRATAPAITVRSKEEIQAEALTWTTRAQGLRVTDHESCLHASQCLKSIKALRKGVNDFWAPHIESAMETKRKAEAARKALADERDRMEAPLVEAETRLKRALLAYDEAQERQRLEQERALQAEAQRLAEAATLEAAAALELAAVESGDDGMRAEAEEILSQPVEAVAVVVPSSVPKVAGVTYRDNWKAHPTVDVRALAAAVAAGTVPVTFLTPNMTAINQFIKATQGGQPVPGVRIYNDRQIAARA